MLKKHNHYQKKLFFSVFCFLLLFTLPGWCQSKNQYTEISYVKLIDTSLMNSIDTMVHYLENNNKDFKKHGYITLTVTEYNRGDTLMMYWASPGIRYLRYFSADWEYPNYYSFVGKRLVVIKLNSLKKFTQPVFSPKSKEHIQQLVNNQLENIDHKVFYDIRGKKVLGKDYPLDVFWLDTEVIVYRLKDNTTIIKKKYL